MYSIVDIETTGGYSVGNNITEIAIIVHNGIEVVDKFHTLVNPRRPIPGFITSLTGISNAMVAIAPAFDEIAAQVFKVLTNTVFVAHIVSFDFSFVKNELRMCGYELYTDKLCTVRLSRKIFPGLNSYSLGNLCNSLGIDIEDRHRAMGDANATVKLFEKILQNGGESHILKTLKKTKVE